MDGVLAPPTVHNVWATLADAATWAGVDRGTLRSFCKLLGDANLSSMQILAVIPDDVIGSCLGSATRGTRLLNAIERAQLVLMINSVRHKFGVASYVPDGVAASSTTATSVAPSGGGKIKIKFSQVIDQGSDVEIEQLDPSTLQRLRKAYVMSEGDLPQEKEEVTDAQISCLLAKLNMGIVPFVDMGVWGPFGERLARQMRFTSQVLKDGQWKPIELPGASSIKTWEEAWRIFRTASIMVGLASTAVLDRYSAEFRQKVQEYPECWHLAAQADIRCRSEWWMQEKRRQEDFHSIHASMSAYNPAQPWNSVIKASAGAPEFWHKEFEKPALLFKVNAPKASLVVHQQEQFGGDFNGRLNNDKRQVNEAKRRDGRYFKSTGGVNICYDWARTEGGCSNEGGCPKHMAHICEWCRQPHRTISCPQVPGWTQESGKAGKGKGKGGGGKGKKRKLKHM